MEPSFQKLDGKIGSLSMRFDLIPTSNQRDDSLALAQMKSRDGPIPLNSFLQSDLICRTYEIRHLVSTFRMADASPVGGNIPIADAGTPLSGVFV